MKGAIKNIIIPSCIGIILFGIELLIALKFHSFKIAVVYPVIYIIAACCIVISYKSYGACGWLQVAVCVSNMLCITYVILLMPASPLYFTGGFALLINWLAIMGACTLLKFVVRGDKYSGFKKFFTLSSIVFGVFYTIILLYALFFKSLNINADVTGFNLVPFATIMPYLTGRATTGGARMNIVANIFLFIPLGFYMQVLLRERKMWFKIMLVILIPILVELAQFIFSLGILDVDDVILNALGGLLGILALKMVEKLYCMVKKDDTARLFLV